MKRFTKRVLVAGLFLLLASSATAGNMLSSEGNKSLFATSVTAAAGSAVDGFIVKDHTLVRYEGNGGKVQISLESGIYKIGEEAFMGNDTITEVSLASCVTEIGDRAFANCVNLESVTLHEGSVGVAIGEAAFQNCGTSAGNFYIKTTSAIRSIGTRAFADSAMKSLGKLVNLEKIGSEVFVGSKLTAYSIDDSLKLESWQVEGAPFYGVEVKTTSSVTEYILSNGVLYNKSKTKILFVNASVEGVFELPTTVKSIKEYAFSQSNVTTVVLNKQKVSLGEGVFENSALQSLEFGEASVDGIPARAFAGSSLQAIDLPSTVRTIGDEAFAECKGLRTIAISGVDSMGSRVFKDCTALTEAKLSALSELGEETFVGATSLKTVTFDDGATTTGEWTFKETAVKEVVFGKNITEISRGVFYGVTSLTEITLPENVRSIGAYAFAECKNLKTVEGLDNVEIFGEYAFCDAGLKILKLSSALQIGEAAFAILPNDNGAVAASYTTLNMPVVERIGAYAFYNGDMSLVNLPSTVQEIGVGAFASARYLKNIRVAEENENFFAEDNVLYRYVDKDGGRYALICYPSARVVTVQSGVKSYSVKDGTERIEAYAFFELNDNALGKVVLPYSIKEIGDRAFYSSGVTTYRFECIDAPVLEAVYREDVAERIALDSEAAAEFYATCPNANFETELCNYSEYGFENSTLVLYYPENGNGYDSELYKVYFEKQISLGIVESETTKLCVEGIRNLPEAADVRAYAELPVTEENLALIQSLAESVKNVRGRYNEIKNDEEQLSFVDKNARQKLFDVEAALRSVKERFGIAVQAVRLELSEESRHKTKYLEGGRFDMSGLVVSLVYDDLSTETVSGTELTLLDTEKLTTADTSVTVEYQGLHLQIAITVTESVGTVGGDSSNGSDSGKTPKDIALYVMGATLLILVGIVVWVLLKNRVNRAYVMQKSEEDDEDEEDSDEA